MDVSRTATDAAPPLKPEETALNAEEWKIEPWRFALYCLGVIAVSWLWSWAHWAAGWALSLVGAFLLGSLFETIRRERADRRAAGEDRRGDRNDPAPSELRKPAINPKGITSTKPSRNPGAESEGLNDEVAGDRA
ncbi:MAG TPA: hypothetical protein VJ302_30450 [Blastocatellia bacterium]|nr:hypothetical protein [Blastocatellia bacterium]